MQAATKCLPLRRLQKVSTRTSGLIVLLIFVYLIMHQMVIVQQSANAENPRIASPQRQHNSEVSYVGGDTHTGDSTSEKLLRSRPGRRFLQKAKREGPLGGMNSADPLVTSRERILQNARRIEELSEQIEILRKLTNQTNNVKKPLLAYNGENKIVREDPEKIVGGKSAGDGSAIKKRFLILYGSHWQSNQHAWWGNSPEVMQGCKYKNCDTSIDAEMADKADIVLFHGTDGYGDLDKWTQHRHKNQRWLWNTLECPYNTPFVIGGQLFNWTSSYSYESDIVTPYGTGYYEGLENRTLLGLRPDERGKDFAADKTGMSIFISSHCGTDSKRELLVEELSKYTQIEKLGQCYDRHLPFGEGIDKRAGSYRFYFAFENSLCTDYISEKPYQWALRLGVVPVVFGAQEKAYTNRFPPNSFIFAEKFKTARDLAEHLNYLGRNNTAYNEYFAWRRDKFYKPEIYETEAAVCQICKKLNLEPAGDERFRKTVNINNFWSSARMCRRGPGKLLKRSTVKDKVEPDLDQ